MQSIYLNHAGTSWPKPAEVIQAAHEVLNSEPTQWPALFSTAHQVVADFFHVDRSRLLLTPSCTAAIQLAIQDHPWETGDRVLTSHFEHHAVHRVLRKLEEQGMSITMLPHTEHSLIDLDALEAELKRGKVRLVALTAACNVTGRLLPVTEAISLAHQFNAKTLIDGAQVAGWWDLNVTELGTDLFTFAGHKGPQAPWGIGGLYVRPDLSMNCPTAACSVSERQKQDSAQLMPGYCDAGSVNLAALAGLEAGCKWLSSPAQQGRLNKARDLASKLTDQLRSFPNLKIYHDAPFTTKVPTVAINFDGLSAKELGKRLGERGLITSAGFQCAPEAHRALGTADSGVVRLSLGPCTSGDEIDDAIDRIMQVNS